MLKIEHLIIKGAGRTLFKRKYIFIAIFLAMVLVLSACSGKDSEADSGTITVSGKEFTEQLIMTHILAEYLKANTDLDVEVEEGLGGSFVVHEALEKGDIDMYVEYTGTGYISVLDKEFEPGTDPDVFYEETKEGYMDEFNIKWLKPLGFNNTYTLAMRSDHAEELGVETFSDLKEYSEDLILGGTPEFHERDDGYDELSEVYGFNFKDNAVLDPDLMYQAVNDGEVDVITAFKTEPKIDEYDLTVLEDDKNFFPPYDAAPVVRQEVLDANPDLEDTINLLAESGVFSDETMSKLNGKVNTEGKKEKDVAIEFLKEHDLID